MKTVQNMLLLATPAVLAALGAHAGSFAPPKGCESFLTVQMKSCQVAIYWRCASAPDGHVWEASYDDAGPLSVTNYDREFQWLDSYYVMDGTREKLTEPNTDPISMSTLLSTGEDRFEFTLDAEVDGKHEVLRVEGHDRLTGKEITIDGLSLLEADTALTIWREDGSVDYKTEGRQYVSSSLRLFFLGEDRVHDNGGVFEYDASPVDFIHPGEVGFNSTKPLYECDSVTSALPFAGSGGQG